MKARGGGSILNITAISAIQPIPKFGLSVASWGAVIGYAKTLALEVARDRINVNTICPGYIETQRLEKVFSGASKPGDVMRKELEAEVPMGRIGTVEDIAHLVALLVSPKGNYITGTVIPVDGGLFRAVR
jgi:3-oxoacyl-[acyl-carrier protein] reductase